jgi:hypothetical protein
MQHSTTMKTNGISLSVINVFVNRLKDNWSCNQHTKKFTRVVYTLLVATWFAVGRERKLKNVQQTRSKDA